GAGRCRVPGRSDRYTGASWFTLPSPGFYKVISCVPTGKRLGWYEKESALSVRKPLKNEKRQAMKTKNRFGVAVVAGLVVLLGGGRALAQPANQYWRTIQGLTQAQYLQNLLAAQQALPIMPAPLTPGFTPGGFVNPYTPSLSGGFTNPWTP